MVPVLVVLLTFFIWMYQHEKQKRTNIEKNLSEKKYEVYMELITLFFEAILNVKKGIENSTDQIDRMTNLNKEIIIYGSDEVIKILYLWTKKAREKSNNLKYFGDILIAIRKDMGYPKTKISGDDFLKQLLIEYEQAKKDGLV